MTSRQALVLTMVLLSVPSAGCAGSDRVRSVADVAADAPFFSARALGQTVNARGLVVAVPGPRTLVLSPDADPRGISLLVVTAEPTTVAVGRQVTVTGTVGQLHVAPAEDGLPYLQQELYARSKTHTYLYDARLEGQ